MTTPHIVPPCLDDVEILYQDDVIIIANKPSGLLSVPGRLAQNKDCLITRIQTTHPSARIVHRLDMDTSGLMVLALDPNAHKHLSKQFEQRQTQKTYRAIVFGIPSSNEGDINLPIICDWPNRPKQKICHQQGKPAHTHYQVTDVFCDDLSPDNLKKLTQRDLFIHPIAVNNHPNQVGSGNFDTPKHRDDDLQGNKLPQKNHFFTPSAINQCFSRILLSPTTGRSHQLRIHLASIGYPILGCDFYAHEHAYTASKRLLLHAESLTLKHPKTNENITFTCPSPF